MEPIIDKKQIGASEDYYENIHAVLNWMEQATQKRKNKWEEIHMSNASEFIIENGYDSAYGARPLKRFIQRTVETAIAKLLIREHVAENSTIFVDASGNDIVVTHSAKLLAD